MKRIRIASAGIGTINRSRAIASVAGLGLVASLVAYGNPALAAGVRLDLRVLVVDDNPLGATAATATDVSTFALEQELATEGVPFTVVNTNDPNRATIGAGYLSIGTEGFYQAVILPNSAPAGLSAAEISALQSYESTFSVRQVDAYDFAGPTVGLGLYQTSGFDYYAGDLNGMSATVTPAGTNSGWGYLSGGVPFTSSSYGYVTTPLTATTVPALPAGASFTPLVTLPIPTTASVGSIVGVYANAGVEQLVVTVALSYSQYQFRLLAHGIISWATHGVHFGYNRNFYSQQFDDAFAYDARWDTVNHCTPTEDCPASVVPGSDIRMSATDVSALQAWQAANGYAPTLAFNGYYSQYDASGNPWNGTDALTNAFQANAQSFRWLNHGYEHIFQGCQQSFLVIPWSCVTTDNLPITPTGSNAVWVPQAAISSEITNNISAGQALGLPFDQAEYLSGEHSGLFLLPQQPVDNPNFIAALGANNISVIGADASRGTAQRQVGTALTVPRHPMAIYYNVSTTAEEVSEYNWIYSPAPNGSGYCTANPTTATCLATPLDQSTGFASYIVPIDTANDLNFILSNDPRPFYAHVSNLTAPDYLGLTLMSSILKTYKSAFAPTTPVVNLTLTQSAAMLQNQANWNTVGMPNGSSVSGYVQDGLVTITNPTATPAPITVPAGSNVNGLVFGENYGGETSTWLAGSAVITTPAALAFTGPTTATFTVGTAGTLSIAATNAATIEITGQTLPAGIAFTDNGNGTATFSGTPTSGSGGQYPITVTATAGPASISRAYVITVDEAPAITSPSIAGFLLGTAGSFTVTTNGYPAPAMTIAGTLPRGLRFVDNGNGTALISGTPIGTFDSTYRVTITARNIAGSATQTLTIALGRVPVFTSSTTANFTAGRSGSFYVQANGIPSPALAVVGGLPTWLTFTDRGSGRGLLTGTPPAGTAGVLVVSLTATNLYGTAAQSLTVNIRIAPTFTSPSSVTIAVAQPFAVNVVAVGIPTPSLSLGSSLPSGLTFVDNGNGSATITGKFATTGSRWIAIRARNSAGSAYQYLQLRVQ